MLYLPMLVDAFGIQHNRLMFSEKERNKFITD
jgi:hypothetical protein